MLGIIGGSGLTQFAGMDNIRQQIVSTPYGEPSAALICGRLQGREVVFLPRHGQAHTIAPHRINYRANLWALHALGVRDVAAVVTVGGISDDLEAGMLVVPDQIIDYTHSRDATYFDGVAQPLAHIDFTQPFCETMRQRLLRAGPGAGVSLRDGGTYGATQGPRLESAAEIDRMARDGAHLVGMTGMPEAALARELGLCYAMIAVVVNPAAGRGASAGQISMDDIVAVSAAVMIRVRALLTAMVQAHGN